ncbi:uncharacterized protein K441DRAFT_176800 [Cenococcum geophilum 1.58]|uniref:uncharacterized protein n=1 Tax=Cenococcum geophilum 1.58 TaxID=794803 RepID=UPI00358E52B0|nr:hypothetical protein K441DRAFT_176800 [Cenococcum geophilum 1.58]
MSCARNGGINLQAALAEFGSRGNSLQEREKGNRAVVTSSLGLLETKLNRNRRERGNRAKYRVVIIPSIGGRGKRNPRREKQKPRATQHNKTSYSHERSFQKPKTTRKQSTTHRLNSLLINTTKGI